MGRSRWHYTLYRHMCGEVGASGWLKLGFVPLWILSQVYRSLVYIHRQSFQLGWRARYGLPCRVISVGNLTVGGTGKTPLAMWLARWCLDQGWQVAVLSRGYGGQSGNVPHVVSPRQGKAQAWSTVGDEPYLLAQELPHVPVVVGKDRVRSGMYANCQFGTQVLILDDGFQHYRLARDLDLVLIDATNPFGHGSLLPRGILREPLQALQRADAVVLTRVELATDNLPAVCQRIRQWYPHGPIYHMKTTVEALSVRDAQSAEETLPLCGRRVVAFVGIGNPSAFAATLTQLGCEVAALLVFRDHHPYTLEDWQAIVETASQYDASGIVTTTKDDIRLDAAWQAPIPLYTLRIDVAFVEGEATLEQQLRTVIADVQDRD
jgi:tetraacyldisaccharide 4'-kinase